MDPFTAKNEMRSRPAGYAIGFALFIMFFAGAFAVLSFYGEVPSWFGWTMCTVFGVAGLSLLVYAIYCAWRGYASTFVASEEGIIWFWTDRAGRTSRRREVAICDIIEVWKSRGSSDIPGGLYLKLRSGDCVDICGLAVPERTFLEWVAENYRTVTLNIE